MEMTQQPKSKNTIPILLLSKLLRTRIMLIDCKSKSKVWISRKSMSDRRPTLLVELVLQKALSLLIAFSIQEPFLFIYTVTIVPKLIHSTHAQSD
jgi:hypothetical protein